MSVIEVGHNQIEYEQGGTGRDLVLLPTLLADETTAAALSHALADGILGADLIELPGIGHYPQLQDPDAFLGAICPFLDTPYG